MKEIFNYLTIISSVVTAILWWYSSTVKEIIQSKPNNSKVEILVSGLILDGNIKLVETLRLQSKWNTKAACMSSVTAVFQVITALLGSWG